MRVQPLERFVRTGCAGLLFQSTAPQPGGARAGGHLVIIEIDIGELIRLQQIDGLGHVP